MFTLHVRYRTVVLGSVHIVTWLESWHKTKAVSTCINFIDEVSMLSLTTVDLFMCRLAQSHGAMSTMCIASKTSTVKGDIYVKLLT